MKKKILIAFLVLALLSVIFAVPKFVSMLSEPDNYWSGFAADRQLNQTGSSISSVHKVLNGNGYRKLTLKKGEYFFRVNTHTEKGSISFILTSDKSGQKKVSCLDRNKEISVNTDTTMYLHLLAKNHKGSYSIEWHKI